MADSPDRILAQIDTTTVAGHNLRALLLRLVDGDDYGTCKSVAARKAVRLRLAAVWPDGTGMDHTSLGREVAERLRPEPWVAIGCDVWRGGLVQRASAAGFTPAIAARIAALLTADDLRAAKAYKAG